MLSVAAVRAVCVVLLLLGASALSGKNERFTTFEELDCKQASITTEDYQQNKVERSQVIDVNKQQSVKEQDSQIWELEDRILPKLQESRQIQNLTQINVTESYKTELSRDNLPPWTKLQTRGLESTLGPILGFAKGFRMPSLVPEGISRTKSYITKGFQTLGSSYYGKPVPTGPERQPTIRETTLSAASKALVSRSPSYRPGSPRRMTRTSSRKQFEPFCVAEEIKNIVMIPGSGEFVYDTKIQTRTAKKDLNNPNGRSQSINEHNIEEKSDALLSLDQLKEDLPNVVWVSVVVNWFGNSLNIQDCEIYPAVEFQENTVVSDDWQVAGINRRNARLISRDMYGKPRYGGTVSDNALIRYINALHRRGYKVMLYPMLVLDTDDKEWRGRLTGQPKDVRSFFTEQYNPFINHYSTIARQTLADGFIIGSEFVGLTKIRDRQGYYPAVLELEILAEEVKNNLGEGVTVTYAADWTEYHHSAGGRYSLDDLWASEYIDVVGINAYFPLTDWPEPSSGYSVQDVIDGWTSGEGYEYFKDYTKDTPEKLWYIDNKWAWKNIERWWSEAHVNLDGSCTKWQPKMKKIWFTEFGFPSVDGCTNEPYLLVDSTSEESKYPRYSRKQKSFRCQKTAIEGTLKKWRNSGTVERMFLYTWDARPFPYFPRKREVWADGVNWETGHWVQGKIGKIIGNKRESVVRAHRSLSLPKKRPPVSGSIRRRSSGGASP